MEGLRNSLYKIWVWILETIDSMSYKYETFKNTVHTIPGDVLLNTYILYFISGMIAGIALSLIILWIGRRT